MDRENLIINEFDDFLLKSEVDCYMKLLKNISTSKELQQKCQLMLTDRTNKMRNLEIILTIIKENRSDEIAHYLMRIIMSSLNNYELWEKLFLIIGCNKHKAVKNALDDVLVIKCFYEVKYLINFK